MLGVGLWNIAERFEAVTPSEFTAILGAVAVSRADFTALQVDCLAAVDAAMLGDAVGAAAAR